MTLRTANIANLFRTAVQKGYTRVLLILSTRRHFTCTFQFISNPVCENGENGTIIINVQFVFSLIVDILEK